MISLAGTIKFTSPEVGTATCIGQLFDEKPMRNKLKKDNSMINLLNLARFAQINDVVKSVKYFHLIKEHTYEKIFKNETECINETVTMTRKPDFSHVVSFKLRINKAREVNVKVCSNGSIQTTGIRSVEESNEFLKHLANVIEEINERAIAATSKPLYTNTMQPTITSISMIIYSFCMLFPSGITVAIDLRKIYDHIVSLSEFYVYYKKKVKSIEIMHEGIVYYIFQSGCINVTSVKSFAAINDSYNFITNFINKHIDKYIVIDMLLYSIDLVEQAKNAPPQKSREWLEERLSCITASEAAKVLGMSYETTVLGESEEEVQSKFIDEKVAAIIEGKPKYITNEAMQHGVCFEPIARHIYQLKIARTKDANIRIFDLGLIKHKQHKYIGASPDGLVFVISKGANDSLRSLFSEDKIIDTHLVEIKCPLYYRPYYNDGKNIACTTGYVPPYYWVQMQQQMFVCHQKHCDFVNCNFTLYKDRQSCLADTSLYFRGVVLKTADGFKYPSDYLMNIYSAENELIPQAKPGDCLIYWRLDAATITEVEYDAKWYEGKAIPKLKLAYDLICNKAQKKINH